MKIEVNRIYKVWFRNDWNYEWKIKGEFQTLQEALEYKKVLTKTYPRDTITIDIWDIPVDSKYCKMFRPYHGEED